MQTKIVIAIAALLPALALGTPTPQGSLACAPPPQPADCTAAVNGITEYPKQVGQQYSFQTCQITVMAISTDPAQQDLNAFKAAANAASAAVLGCGSQAGIWTNPSCSFAIQTNMKR